MIRFIQIYPKLTSKKNHTFSQTTPPIFSKTNRIFKSRPSFFKETHFFQTTPFCWGMRKQKAVDKAKKCRR